MIVCVTILVGCKPQMAGLYPDSNRLSRGRKPAESGIIPSGSPLAERPVWCGSCKEASSSAAVARRSRVLSRDQIAVGNRRRHESAALDQGRTERGEPF